MNMTIAELKTAQSIHDNNPIRQLSGDLRSEGRTVEKYISRWTPAE